MSRGHLALPAMMVVLAMGCGDGQGQIPQPPLNAGPAVSTLFSPGWSGGTAPAGSPFPDPTSDAPVSTIQPGGDAIEGDWFICVGGNEVSNDVCSRLLSPGFGLYGGRIAALIGDSEVMSAGDSYCEVPGAGSYSYNGQLLVLHTSDGDQSIAISLDGDRAHATSADGESGTLLRIDPSRSTGQCQYTDLPQAN